MKTAPEPTLIELIRYNNWANQQILKTCRTLSDDQQTAIAPGTYGTIRDTLEHIIRAESSYIARLTGVRPPAPFQWEDKPGLDEMSAYATQVGEALLEAVMHVQPTDWITQQWEGKTIKYQAVAILIQVINHGIEHRTNITTILSQNHLASPDVDGWGYLWAHIDQFGAP